MAEKRTRGAQPGNTNALKHGFYSRTFRNLEESDLDFLSEGLSDEIAMVRVALRRFFDLFQNESSDDLVSWSVALGTLGMTSTRLASLLRTQTILEGGAASDVAAALSDALTSVVQELGIK